MPPTPRRRIAPGHRLRPTFGTQQVVATVSPLENLAQKDDHPESKFTAVGVHIQQGAGSGSSQVLGEIVSGYQQPVHQVYVSVACFDASGTIIGGGGNTMSMRSIRASGWDSPPTT